MNLSGLIGLIFGLGTAVLVVGALAVYFAQSRRTENALAGRMAQAQPGAMAKVIELGSSYTSRNYGDVSVAMRLEVTPAFGPDYQTISVWQVEPAHVVEVQVGKTLPVKVDAQNPKIIYPDVPWATQPDTTEFNEDDMTN
jgi:hypothetical protein